MEHEQHPGTGGGSGLDDLSYDECVTRLEANVVGRIALLAHERLVVVPVNHKLIRMDGNTFWIVFRTQLGGLLDQTDVRVAFEIDQIDVDEHAGWSVLVQGTLQRLDPDAADVRQRFDPEPWPISERERWMAIEPFAISGRRIADG